MGHFNFFDLTNLKFLRMIGIIMILITIIIVILMIKWDRQTHLNLWRLSKKPLNQMTSHQCQHPL